MSSPTECWFSVRKHCVD